MNLDDFSLCLYNDDEVSQFIDNALYDKSQVIVVVLVDKVWCEDDKFAYNYFDRIVITPTANLRPQAVSYIDRMLRWGNIFAFDKYMHLSLKRHIARKWGNS